MRGHPRLFLLACISNFAFSAEIPVSGAVPEGLAASDWAAIQTAYEAGQHAAYRGTDGTVAARNPNQFWRAEFDGRGFTVIPDHGRWTWGLELTGYGDVTLASASSEHLDDRISARNAELHHEGGRITCQRDQNLTEWFVNDARGLEQGWTFHQRPARSAPSALLRLRLCTRGNLRPQVSPDRSSVSFQQETGVSALSFGALKAWDADGRNLAVHFEPADDATILIAIEDQSARYPITVDPIAQQAYLKASNTEMPDVFAHSVAVYGDTVIVGCYNEGSNATGVNGDQGNNNAIGSGAAYVFVRNGGIWTQQAYLKASNTGTDDRFGSAVAISMNTVVVGTYNEDSNAVGVNGDETNNSASNAGAAYVFYRNGTTWTQQAYLKASNTGTGDCFGYSVAIYGDTVVVGARLESSSATGVNGNQSNDDAPTSGAAYVFTRSGIEWTQQAYLKANNTGAGDHFGASVSVSGETVAVGAEQEDSSSTGVNGNGTNNNAPEAGAAYVFTRNGTSWAQQAYVKASNTGASDWFGSSLAVSGDTLLVGARGEDSSSVGVNGAGTNNNAQGSGAAYVFTRSGIAWTQQAYLKASNTGVDDGFGCVAISGNTVVIGAYGEDSNSRGVNGNETNNDTQEGGAAYIFTRNGTKWTQQAYLKASNTEQGNYFGNSVAVSGDAVIVGASSEWSNATGVNGDQANKGAPGAGAAYVFTGISGTTSPDIAILNTLWNERTFTIGFTSGEGLTSWRIKGSSTLEGFTDDLTNITTFVEVSPGFYQSVTDLTGYPEIRYFLRIER